MRLTSKIDANSMFGFEEMDDNNWLFRSIGRWLYSGANRVPTWASQFCGFWAMDYEPKLLWPPESERTG